MKNRIAIKITLIYFLTGFLWILFSDLIIQSISGSAQVLSQFQTYKGWFFVGVTALLLFLLIRNEIRIKNKIESDLVIAKTKAEESDLLKSAFLSNMSHEIRTPLNGILGFSELILDDSFTAKDKEVFAKHLCKNGNDLAKLINDILDISRIQENQYPISKKTVKINALLEVIFLEYRQSDLAAMRNKINFRLITGTEDTEFEIYSDPIKLMQVFKNLLNNAFFFTSEGYIHFGYEIKDSTIEFFVEDSGCGINESNREYIFKPFFKGKNKFIGSNGFGLGLAISKGLVRLLGGDLQYSSTIDKGTRFYFCMENKDILSREQLPDNYEFKKKSKFKAISFGPMENKMMQN